MKYERMTMINNGFIDTNCRNCKQCKKVGRKYICNDMTACDEEIINRLCELEDKIENGTLIELPCKVGDTVYFIVKRRHKIGFEPYIFIKKTKLTFYNLKKVLDGFNYTVFLTKAVAEKKLKEYQGK